MLKTVAIPERARNVVIAVAVAAFAAMLTAFYVSNYKQRVQRDQQNVPVVVAKGKIEPGTLGSEVISKKLATIEEVPRHATVAGAFSNLDQLEGLITSEKIYPGEQVTARRFAPKAERGIRTKLDGNLRAIEVPGDPEQVLAGTIREGDHVDAVANFAVDTGASGTEVTYTRTILHDILVLRGAKSDEEGVGSSDQVSVQLALTDAQAQKLYFAMENATHESGTGWWLTMRPVNNAADSPESVETFWTMLRDGLRTAQIRKAFFGAEVAR